MKALKRLIPYFRPYRAGLAFGLFLVIASSGLTSVVPWLLRDALDAMERGAPMTRIWTLVGYMLALALIGGIARYGMREMLNGISRRIEYDLRNDLFAHLELLDAGYFARTRTGEIMARLTSL